MINWHKWTESANTIKIKSTTNKSTQQIVDSSKQYKIMNTDITKIVNVRKDVTYKSINLTQDKATCPTVGLNDEKVSTEQDIPNRRI